MRTRADSAGLTAALREQIERGFVLLRFMPYLEADFREYLRHSGRRSRLTLLLITLAALLTVPFIDASPRGLPHGLAFSSHLLQLGLMLPIVLILGTLSLYRRRSPLFEWLMVAILFLTMIDIMAQRVIDSSAAFDLPLALTGVVIVAVFALARVRFWIMLPCVAISFLGVLLTEWSFVAPLPSARYDLFVTCILLVVGVCTGYYSEYFIRWTWLNGALLRYLSRVDGLTGLLNRPALEDALAGGLAQARRESREYAIAMVDIDGFGDYNDYYGHQVGDAALRQVADVLGARVRRPRDLCGRYGGEEFLLFWMDGSPFQMRSLAEAARTAVEKMHIAHSPSRATPWVTVSIGLCHVDADATDARLGQVITVADRLLYAAKAAGRNRVRMAHFADAVGSPGRSIDQPAQQYQAE